MYFDTVGLVTFRRNKYLTAETFKTGFGARKNGNKMYSSNLRYIFNILSIWEKSVFLTIFVPVLQVFLLFTCKNGGFWVFSSILVIFMVEKDNFHMTLDLENFTVIFSWSENANPMLHWLQYMQHSHDLIKTLHHESW